MHSRDPTDSLAHFHNLLRSVSMEHMAQLPSHDVAGVYRCLRECQLERLASLVIQLGIRSPNELVLRAPEMLDQGIQQHHVEMLVSSCRA